MNNNERIAIAAGVIIFGSLFTGAVLWVESPPKNLQVSSACGTDTRIAMLITVQQYLIPGYSYEHLQGIPGALTTGFVEGKRRALEQLEPWIESIPDPCEKQGALAALKNFENELNQLERIRMDLKAKPLPALPVSGDCAEWTTAGDVSDTPVPCGATIPFSVVQQSGANSANVVGNNNIVNGKKGKP